MATGAVSIANGLEISGCGIRIVATGEPEGVSLANSDRAALCYTCCICWLNRPRFVEGRRMLRNMYPSSSMDERDTAMSGMGVRFFHIATTTLCKVRSV